MDVVSDASRNRREVFSSDAGKDAHAQKLGVQKTGPRKRVSLTDLLSERFNPHQRQAFFQSRS